MRNAVDAPGLFVGHRFAMKGMIYLVDLGQLRFGCGGTEKWAVVHSEDWARLSPAQQEEVAAIFTKRAVKDGIAALERMLRAASPGQAGEGHHG